MTFLMVLPDRNTVAKGRRFSDEIKARYERDRKLFYGGMFGKSIKKDLDSIGDLLRGLLPQIQSISVFDKEQVTKLSSFIDKYDKYKYELIKTYRDKNSPEEW